MKLLPHLWMTLLALILVLVGLRLLEMFLGPLLPGLVIAAGLVYVLKVVLGHRYY